MKTRLYTIGIVLAVIVAFGLVFDRILTTVDSFQQAGEESASASESLLVPYLSVRRELKSLQEEARVYHILAGGDVMLDRGVEKKVLGVGGGDWTFPWHNIAEVTNKADMAFINFEGSASDVGRDTGKKFSFRFDPASIEGLMYAGIDIVSLANNHMLDWGRDSLCQTVARLDTAEIAHVGGHCTIEEANTPHIALLGDTKVAWIAYTTFYDGAHGVSDYDIPKIKEQIRMLKEEEGVDVVLMSMHWGIEYKTRSSASQQKIAHELIDAGLDVLVGHHPHVVQEIERYGDGWIIYSLGNFIFDQYFSAETMRGLLVDIQIQNGSVRDIVPIPIVLNEDYQPSLE